MIKYLMYKEDAVNLRKTVIIAIVILLAVVAIAGKMTGKKPQVAEAESTTIPVRTAFARTGTMTTTIDVSGSIKALKTVQISAKAMGRVVSVPCREDDSVSAGAVVVQQDTSDLLTDIKRAEAGVFTARANLSKAMTASNVTDVSTEARIAQAKAAVESAKARLRTVKASSRPQEIAIRESAVESARADFENAKVDLQRTRELYAQGAQSRQQMDIAQKAFTMSSAGYNSARQALDLAREGARLEDIESAQKDVERSEQDLRMAVANRANKSLNREDIKSARAGMASAEANLAYYRQQLANAAIRTPISGCVSKRMTEPGQMASPGTPLMEIVNLSTVYFEAAVSEMDIHKVKLGQIVNVQVDALPGKSFAGKVAKILPTAEIGSRQFTVWINIPNKGRALRPGMFARGKIELEKHDGVILVSKDAVINVGDGGVGSVYVVRNLSVHLTPVRIGEAAREEVEVLSGLKPGDEVVVMGQDKLSDNMKVTIAR
jgi:HlyD family secretion protein